ncbi:MAG: hypothetical protein QOK05_2851 [Chloroflexota bacterium]|jgi:Flp pilus assembly protein TadG|nr:hypothetical protein [Chloroflexota bacterium]
MTRIRPRQEGQVAVMFAIVLALVLSGLIALVGDVILLYDAAGRYDNGALVGAQAGASQVDPGLLRQGQVALDSATAISVCVEAASITSGLAAREITCTVSADNRSVTAHVSHRVPLAFAAFGPGLTITRDHTGTIAIGESQGSSP